MLAFLRSLPFTDPVLGELRRSRGAWRGTIALQETSIPLVLPGLWSAPDSRALHIAHCIPCEYAESRALIAAALFDHYSPYAEAVATGELEPPEQGLPRINHPDEVWPHTAVQFVAVSKLDRQLMIEVGYRVAWDEEHLLGALLRNGQLIELNGSVLPP